MKQGERFHRPSPGTRFIDSGLLYMIAVDAARSIAAPPREGGETQALVSIAFSVITLEAFLNEATEFALAEAVNPKVAVYAHVMATLEKTTSLEKKFSVAHSLCVGRPADFGAQPYQDLGLLVAVRNELLHFRPTPPLSYEPEYHPIREGLRKQLRSKNVLAENVNYAESWIFHAGTKAMAEWSCKTAAAVALDLLDRAADGLNFYLHPGRENFEHNLF